LIPKHKSCYSYMVCTGPYQYRQGVKGTGIDNREVKKDSSVPIYSQVERIVMDMIDSGQLTPGDRAPSERQIAEQLSISRMTVRAAVSRLVTDGYLYSVPGKGTFVSTSKLRQDLLELTSFTEDMLRRGLQPGARLLEISVISEAPARAYKELSLQEGEDLVCIYRLRTADAEPMCLETSYLPSAQVPWILTENLEDGSLYEALQRHGIELAKAEEHLEATLVREAESELLTVPLGCPALLVERTTYTVQDEPIEYVKSVYRGDRYRFTTMLLKRKYQQWGRGFQ
jgi:GntR family transcriptional regulator